MPSERGTYLQAQVVHEYRPDIHAAVDDDECGLLARLAGLNLDELGELVGDVVGGVLVRQHGRTVSQGGTE